MAYTLTYFDEVENDVAAAKLYYRASSEGLEKRFANAIELAILKLQQWPAAYAIRYKNVRIAYPVIFPYAIHFYIDEKKHSIIITAIVFAGRDPKIAKTRI
jgi:hypothetical protein